ncbi:hypothetical protein VUR80DRAFT_2396 [Thermomyces stellatus]
MGGKSPTPKYSRAHIDPAPCVPTGAVVPLDMGRTRSVVFHTTPRAQYLNVSNPRIGCTSRSRLPPTAWLHGSQRRWWEGQQPSTQQYRSQRRAPGRALRGRSSLDENRSPVSPLRFDDCAILPSSPLSSYLPNSRPPFFHLPFTHSPGPFVAVYYPNDACIFILNPFLPCRFASRFLSLDRIYFSSGVVYYLWDENISLETQPPRHRKSSPRARRTRCAILTESPRPLFPLDPW